MTPDATSAEWIMERCWSAIFAATFVSYLSHAPSTLFEPTVNDFGILATCSMAPIILLASTSACNKARNFVQAVPWL